jgi:hypothetical protein
MSGAALQTKLASSTCPTPGIRLCHTTHLKVRLVHTFKQGVYHDEIIGGGRGMLCHASSTATMIGLISSSPGPGHRLYAIVSVGG